MNCDLKVGDTVKVVCLDRAAITCPEMITFVGTLKSKFNAWDGEDNWHYEIKDGKGKWFLFKPLLDGGSITKVSL